ncbi:MAG: hypothetical protein R3C15_22545 [Thermoleophilia bacterium]
MRLPATLVDRLPSSPRGRAILAAGVVALAGGGAIAGILLSSGGERAPEAPLLQPRLAATGADPFAFAEARVAELERRAAFGRSHVLYTAVPGGAIATAQRVAAFRPQIEAAAREAGIDPDLVEGLVYVESAGRPEVIAGSDPEAASGLTQIVAQTGIDFLDMEIDLPTSRELTLRIAEAEARGDVVEAERLRLERRRADPRFDPAKALAATMRYLQVARARFGRVDLAFVSYHMGIGNLDRVLRAYAQAREGATIKAVVERNDLSYARVYFDSGPDSHAAAWNRLRSLSDDSRNYYWKVLGAREIMRLYRADRPALERLAALMTAKNSLEEALHPPDETVRYEEPDDLRAAWDARELVAVPDDPRLFLDVDPALGELADELGEEPELYRGLRPEALATLLYTARRVHDLSGAAALSVTSAVRDQAYQDRLVETNVEATREYSLHTTGYAFDIRREYASDEQAAAFQFVLERLEALGVIAWVREPEAIHVTVGPDAAALVPLELEPAVVRD